jgi:hypothetical protein
MLEEDDSSSRQEIAWMLSSLAREMYFPIRVWTPHQVLKFSLFGKGWEMMLSYISYYHVAWLIILFISFIKSSFSIGFRRNRSLSKPQNSSFLNRS